MNLSQTNLLLKSEDPSLKYRINTELLDLPVDEDVNKDLYKEILVSKAVKDIFKKMHPDGYWLQTNPRTKETVGDDVKYGSFASTHFCLSYLSELGLTKTHPLVAKAAERYLRLQKLDGDFWNHMSCLLGYNLYTFIRLGYCDDERVQKVINLLLNTNRRDGGYLCDMHEQKRKNKKSCIRGAAQVLMAFSLIPEYWKHPRIVELTEYFLKRGGIYNSKGTNFTNKDMQQFTFPFTWRTNSFQILLALSKMGHGNDNRLNKAWEYLFGKQDKNGMYELDYTPSQSPWKVGKKGQINEWVTFYILLAQKFK